MKGRNKIISFIMCFALMLSCMMPAGGSLWAEGIPPINITNVSDVTKLLSKGDAFMAAISFSTVGGIKAKEIDEKIQYIEVSGSATEYSRPYQITPVGKEDSEEGILYLHDVKYNGKGNTVNVEIGFKGDIAPLTTSISLTNTETVLGANEGLSVSNNLINAVAGQTQQLTVTIKNNSNYRTEAGQLELKLKDKNDAKGIVLKKTKFDIPELQKGGQVDINFSVSIDDEVTRGIHELEANISGNSQTIKLKVDSNFMPPSLQVSVSNTTAFEANVPKPIQINIKNVGQIAAKNVKVEITSNDKVSVTDGSNVRYLESVESGKSQTLPVSLMISDTTAFSVPVEMKLSYIDDLGKEQTSSQIISLSTKGSVAQRELDIITTSEPNGLKQIGDVFSIGFKVTAPDGAKNVKISAKSTDGIVSKSKSIFIEPSFSKGQAKSYKVDFVATQGVTTGTYPIEISAEYTLNGKDVSLKQFSTVSIDNPKSEEGEKGKGKPKVIIGTYSSDPVVVKAGEQFKLELGFLNTNQDKTVKNLKANITVKEQGENDTGSVFTPVGASNTFFIDTLNPGQMDIKHITLYTIPSAKPKTYEVSVEMEYEDETGEAITATERIGIPVEQVTKIEIADIQVPFGEVGMPIEINANIYNTGKTNITNMKVNVVGEGLEVQDGMMFVGSFEKGNSEMYMPTLIPMQAGTLHPQIVIEYEDATGVVQTITHDFTMEVNEMAPPIDPGMGGDMGVMPPVEEVKPAKWPVALGVVLGVGIAAGITALVLKKRRNRLDEMDIDED